MQDLPEIIRWTVGGLHSPVGSLTLSADFEIGQGIFDRGEDGLGVAEKGGTGPSRRRTFRVMETYGIYTCGLAVLPSGGSSTATVSGTLAINDLEVDKAANQGVEGQHVLGGTNEETGAWCTYCGRILDDVTEKSEGNDLQAPVPCPRQKFMHIQ